MTTRQVLRGLLALLIAAPPLLAAPLQAAAADFPIANKPIRLVVGFPAGGGTDLQARTVAQHLAPLLGVPVIVDNRPGAGTMLAAMEVVRSAPDGHTLMYTPASTLSQLPHTLATGKYDTFNPALHAQVHAVFAAGMQWTVDQLVDWLYRELFLMPPDDPALGLDVPDPFSAVPGPNPIDYRSSRPTNVGSISSRTNA